MNLKSKNSYKKVSLASPKFPVLRFSAKDGVNKKVGVFTDYGSRITERGIALVAVLAVLTVLAILAATFITLTSIQSKTSKASLAAFRANLLIESGLQHSISLIQNDISKEGLLCDSPETDPMILQSDAGVIWHIVSDKQGKPIGRYKIQITDESSKINVNFLPELAQHVVQKSKNERRKPKKSPLFSLVKPTTIKKILAYQYGPNKLPGMRNVDDNNNNILLENDGIDNDFNGVIDELDEGVDEPAEFNVLYPNGDDRVIDSLSEISEMLQLHSPDGKSSKIDKLSKIFSAQSVSHTLIDDDSSSHVDINGATVRHIAKAIRQKQKLKGAARKQGAELARFACNIADFRDENHVISTYAGGYGVEAVCFSEIMANDASRLITVQRTIPEVNRNKVSSNEDDTINTYRGILGCMIDPMKDNEPVSTYPMRPVTVTKVGANVKVRYKGPKLQNSIDYTVNYKEFVKMLKKRGKTAGDEILYPKDFWKNAHMIFKINKNDSKEKINSDYSKNGYDYYPKVISSDARTVTVEGKWGKNNISNTYDTLIDIQKNNTRTGFWLDNHWERDWDQHSVIPKCTEWSMVEVRPRTYYHVYVGNNNVTRPFFSCGISEELDCDGIPAEYSETSQHLLKWEYKEGIPLRTDKHGFMDVFVTSSKNCNKRNWANLKADTGGTRSINPTKSVMRAVVFMRPDIVELVNISDKPVSIAGWRVMINTGSVAKELCKIDSATHYERSEQRYQIDDNPAILPGGYAYLTSDESVFDIDYGAKPSGKWGDSYKEAYPCYELPRDVWGVWYKISGFRPAKRNLWSTHGAPGTIDNNIVLEGADFNDGEMIGEMIEFRTDRKNFPGKLNLNGYRRMVTGNTKNAIETLYGQAGSKECDIRKGDYVVLLGMPRNGGLLSFTLRNEYNQVASRTVEYGKTDYMNYDYSTERTDPTVLDSWRNVPEPTFGGYYSKALSKNKSARKKLVINNRPLGSFKDMLYISSGKTEVDFLSNEIHAKDFLSSYGAAFSLSGKRFDAESANFSYGGTKQKGWQSNLKIVDSVSGNSLSANNANWKPEKWKGHTLSFLSGKSRGEQFKIIDNAKSIIKISGLSTQNRIKLKAYKGDKFIVGPSYKTPMFYCRKSNARGVWEWKNTGLKPGSSHDLYFFGLNDSINTTEFLEENHNAKLTVKLWNYKTKKWDSSPKKNYKYGKNDSFHFGKIMPANISEAGSMKISITPHNLIDESGSDIVKSETELYKRASRGCSGVAWFDYIYIAPTERAGRINVNTAETRVLAALPGISLSLARNIVNGTSADKSKVRPYKNIFDLLKVKGMTTDILCEIADYLTVRSDAFRVNITAEIFKTSPESKTAGQENITARQISTYIVEREQNENKNWKITQKENISIN